MGDDKTLGWAKLAFDIIRWMAANKKIVLSIFLLVGSGIGNVVQKQMVETAQTQIKQTQKQVAAVATEYRRVIFKSGEEPPKLAAQPKTKVICKCGYLESRIDNIEKQVVKINSIIK